MHSIQHQLGELLRQRTTCNGSLTTGICRSAKQCFLSDVAQSGDMPP